MKQTIYYTFAAHAVCTAFVRSLRREPTMYSSPSIERPLPQKTTSSYRPLSPCTNALTVHTIKPPLEDHLLLETKLRWI